ncbi:hypothetical protein MPER_16110, partial [Moniliophthora perniciosa FA553]
YTGKKGLIDSPNDVGGLEDWPSSERESWDVDLDGDGIADWWDGSTGGDGYTAMDGWLNFLAEPHVFVNPGSSVEMSLVDLARGFNKPTFEATASEGTVSVSGDTATYEAPAEPVIAYVTVNINDSEGTTWERTVGVGVVVK